MAAPISPPSFDNEDKSWFLRHIADRLQGCAVLFEHGETAKVIEVAERVRAGSQAMKLKTCCELSQTLLEHLEGDTDASQASDTLKTLISHVRDQEALWSKRAAKTERDATKSESRAEA